MSYINKYFDELTELTKTTNLREACRILKRKHKLNNSVDALRHAYRHQYKKRNLTTETKSKTSSNNYQDKKKFVLSAWNKKGYMMDIDEYCKHYNLPRTDITSYKLVSHTGTPFYNIVFKENITEQLQEFDFNAIIQKYIKPVTVEKKKYNTTYDFDTLTYTDAHIGMDTDADNNSMYAEAWNEAEVITTAQKILHKTLENRKSSHLIVDDLGDLLDGFNGKTVRSQHDLPQNMTNEQMFDCALQFKMLLLDGFAPYYKTLTFNNVCNDNHAGSFGYFVNKAFKDIAAVKYNDVTVNNHRTFLSHYFVNDVCFVISHGKDDKTLKFGFKPDLDSKGLEKIDHYCKHHKLYGKAKRIVFKKGDSHQALFDMCTSDDFDYFNYPAISPASQWVQNNFKKSRKGFVIENFKGVESTLKPIFY